MSTINKLQKIIIEQAQNVPYNSHDASSNIKQCAHQSFFNVLELYPIEMTHYLTKTSKQHFGFQAILFQELIKLLEATLPFQIIKNKQPHLITHLLDDNLHLFDGVSIFQAMVNEKQIIKNNTQEFYVGGRKATLAKPYFIGRVLEVKHRQTNASLLHLVSRYSFSQIQMRDVSPGTFVNVSHLRISPHYQMGGMLHLNRARQSIISQLKGKHAI